MIRSLPLAASLSLAACMTMPGDDYGLAETAREYTQEQFGEIAVTQLRPGVWMHTSTLSLPGIGPVRSNGLLVLDGDRTILVDTAWTDDQTRDILAYARDVIGAPVARAVITHAHQDKMGGIAALHEAGVESWAHSLTNEFAPEHGFEPARNTLRFGPDGFATNGAFGPLRVFSPGPGHTKDNIAVGLADGTLAFGGCLIKGAESRTLGNLMDADTGHFAAAARAFGQAFPNAQTIVMSHSPPQGREAIAHTVKLAEAL